MRIRGFLFSALALVVLVGPARPDWSPSEVRLQLAPGESQTVEATLQIPPFPSKMDVVLAVDLSSTMTSELLTLQGEIESTLADLRAATGSDLRFGLVTYEDYPGTVDSRGICYYSNVYGAATDVPFHLDLPLTDVDGDVVDAVMALVPGSGGDGAESQARVFDEVTRSDVGIGWREGAMHVLLHMSDQIPHDCDLHEGLPSTCRLAGALGVDPGRDGLVGTMDDLDFQATLDGLRSAGIRLIHLASGPALYQCAWSSWADRAGGLMDALNRDGSVPGGGSLSSLLLNGLWSLAGDVRDVSFATDADCPLQVTFDPPYVDGLAVDPVLGATVTVQETVTLPSDAVLTGDDIACTVRALAGGVCAGEQSVVVEAGDRTPPVVTSAAADPGSLWPPDHRMVDVALQVEATDDSGAAPLVRITGVDSNEAGDAAGSGRTASDWEITGDLTLRLRAERDAHGDGRTYTIHFVCSDDAGNETTGDVEVLVPLDRRSR